MDAHISPQYFATRRSIVKTHQALLDFDESRPNVWKSEGSMLPMTIDALGKAPLTCSQETVGLIGYGPIGQSAVGSFDCDN